MTNTRECILKLSKIFKLQCMITDIGESVSVNVYIKLNKELARLRREFTG